MCSLLKQPSKSFGLNWEHGPSLVIKKKIKSQLSSNLPPETFPSSSSAWNHNYSSYPSNDQTEDVLADTNLQGWFVTFLLDHCLHHWKDPTNQPINLVLQLYLHGTLWLKRCNYRCTIIQLWVIVNLLHCWKLHQVQSFHYSSPF